MAGAFLLAGYFAFRIRLEEDITKILPADQKLEKLNQVFQESRFSDRLLISISLKDSLLTEPGNLVVFAEEIVPLIEERLSAYIKSIQAKADESQTMELLEGIQENLPVYLEEYDYVRIDTLIQRETLRATLEQNIRTLSSPSGFALNKVISKDPSGISFIALRKLERLKYDENLVLYDGYLLSSDEKNLMVFITPEYPPGNTGKNALFIKGLDSIITEMTSNSYPHIHADYFGATAVSAGNAVQLRNDALLTQGVTVLFLIVFLAVYFRKKSAPFIILLPVIFGVLFSLAIISLLKENISVIAIGTGSIVLGIAVNYSLHIFNHYRHVKNMEAVISDLTFPMTIGGLTTVGGFLCLLFTESAMLRDLGLFAAFSLVGAALASLLFLPHLIGKTGEANTGEHPAVSWIDRLASYRPEYNKYLVLLVIGLTIFFSFFAGRVGFESDMMNMNFMSPELKKAEAKMNSINAYALQSVYLIAEGKTLEEALQKNERISRKMDSLVSDEIVKKYSGVSSLLLSDSLKEVRIKRWNQYWTTEKRQYLFELLQREGEQSGYRKTAFNSFRLMLDKNYSSLDTIADFPGNPLASDFISMQAGKATIVTIASVSPDKRTTVYRAFEAEPDVTVLDKQYITSRLVEIINADFTRIALMTSVLVFVVLLITYGRIELALVCFIPMLITWIWILGIMGVSGLQFNIINIIISALIFGLGDDYSLFIMDGLMNEYRTGKKNLSSFKSAIFLSALTTVTGLGVLIFAKHPALKSIAVISIIGIVSVVLIAQILIPFFFTLLIKNRIKSKQFPWTIAGFSISVFAFFYFVSGCILSTIIGLLFYLIKPFGREKVKLAYHVIISKFCWSLMYIMSNQKKRIINAGGEDFKKPAIIISNHQSFLDILSMIMLYPKLILFTNKWVWNSPVFGAVVRMADYFPVAKGVENSLELIEDRIRQGYSVVIFPEGTRSEDGNIRRFHKGAFYLAEKLQLDILPVVIHGTGYTMTKGDFLLKNGIISLKILPRVHPQNGVFGKGYTERTKAMGKYFRAEYEELRKATEQPAYFRETLKYNYIYKGPVLEWYMRVKTSLEKYYQPFHELLPEKGSILDIGCGYGFMSYTLYLASPQRQITGIDYDEEKIETAKHCFSKNEQIQFVSTNVSGFNFEAYDNMILSDVLHYLSPEEQNIVIRKCIKHLNPGGLIVIRDGNAELEKKHKGTVLTEFFSTKLLGFNKARPEGLFFLSGNMIREIASAYGLECREIDQTKFTSNMLFILKKPVNSEYANG